MPIIKNTYKIGKLQQLNFPASRFYRTASFPQLLSQPNRHHDWHERCEYDGIRPRIYKISTYIDGKPFFLLIGVRTRNVTQIWSPNSQNCNIWAKSHIP